MCYSLLQSIKLNKKDVKSLVIHIYRKNMGLQLIYSVMLLVKVTLTFAVHPKKKSNLSTFFIKLHFQEHRSSFAILFSWFDFLLFAKISNEQNPSYVCVNYTVRSIFPRVSYLKFQS